MTSKKPNLKMQSRQVAITPVPLIDDENRIDWERRTRKTKDVSEEEESPDVLEVEVESETTQFLERDQRVKNGKKKHKKTRHFVMDEDSGRVIVKRRRKENRSYDDWHDDYE